MDPKKDPKSSDNMELLKQQASSCGPGCACNSTTGSGKGRWIIGLVVLAAAGVMVVHGMVNKRATQAPAEGFASPVATQPSGVAGTAAEVATGGETTVGTTIGAFADLNTVAAKTDAVFVFLPGKEGSGKAPSVPMKSAARAIEAKGMKCGLFTLKPGSADYDQIAKQMAVPGVVALVKGGRMSAVSGEVTEAKLLQGYVGACSSGGCGPGASAGCCPK